jgi:hypothetical protein
MLVPGRIGCGDANETLTMLDHVCGMLGGEWQEASSPPGGCMGYLGGMAPFLAFYGYHAMIRMI